MGDLGLSLSPSFLHSSGSAKKMSVSKTRKIGNDDVTAIGYGAMGIAAFYGSIQPDETRLKVRVSVHSS